MDDKELANHLTMLTVTDWSRGTAVDAMRKAASRLRELVADRAKYDELLYAVGNKYEGETRHQTALRYIVARESQTGGPASTKTEPTP